MVSNEVSNGASNWTSNGTSNGTNGIKTTNGTSHNLSKIPSVDVAVSANESENVVSMTQSIQSLGKSYSASEETTRLQLLSEARQLVRALETPRETMIKHNWAQVSDASRQPTSFADISSLPLTWRLRSASTLGFLEQ